MLAALEPAILSGYSQAHLGSPWNCRARPVPPHSLRRADFRAIRLEGRLYVDKTRFPRPLEDERSTIPIRPRRFGKSCLAAIKEAKRQLRRYLADERLGRCIRP